MRFKRSIEPAYFERLYREKGDPWEFSTSPYERNKYQHTLEALPRPRYAKALEIGCAIGVFTRNLAARCGSLLAIDVSETALSEARKRCADVPHVAFKRMRVPQDVLPRGFDLIVLSEVAYYWDTSDLERAATALQAALQPGGDLALVHYTAPTNYPQSGDDAVEALRSHFGGTIEVLSAERRYLYRLDVWRRLGGHAETAQQAH